MALVVIIGASRGIGLGLVQAYVAQGQRVIATVRNAADKARLQAEGAEVLVVDVANPASVSGLAWQLEGEEVDLALYVAGVWSDLQADCPPSQEEFDRVMHTNVLGAMQVLPQVAPLVAAAGGVFGLLSSEMSQLHDAAPDAWLYRTSKAALNMVVASSQQPGPVAGRPHRGAGPGLGADRHGRPRRHHHRRGIRAGPGADAAPGDGRRRRPFAAPQRAPHARLEI